MQEISNPSIERKWEKTSSTAKFEGFVEFKPERSLFQKTWKK